MADRILDKELDTLKNDLGALRDDVASLSRLLAEKGGAKIDNALADGKARVQAGIGAVEGQVTAHPLASLLVAFGAGILLARLTGNQQR